MTTFPKTVIWTNRKASDQERVSPPKRIICPIALGMRENTRMTVTYREALFAFNSYCVFVQDGVTAGISRLLFLLVYFTENG